MTNIVAVLIVRCTHTGVYADGRPNTASVTIYDLDEITIQKNRERAVPVPPNSSVDIPMSTRTFVSWHQGAICKFTKLGLITSEIILQLRDKDDCGGPAGTGQALRPAVPNIERVGNLLRLVIPDNTIPTNLESVGFLVGEPVEITGLTGAFRTLNGEYVISTATPGSGLAGVAAGSYLLEMPSTGADIASTTLAGVNICLTEGRVTTQFNSNGDVGGLGTNVFGYIGGQLFPNSGSGGGGTAPANAEYVVLSLDPTLTDERVLTAGTGIVIVDGGANGPVTLTVDLTLAELLANGNTTSGFNIVVSTGDEIVGQTDLVLNPGPGVGDNVIIDGLTWPDTDGAPGDVLTTDGAGNLSFQPEGVETFTSGEAITTGDLLALNTSGDVIRANSSIAAGNYEVIGVSAQTVGAGVSVQVITHSGVVTNVNFTAAPAAASNGNFVFLSSTSGLASAGPPSPPGGNAFFTIGTLQGADGATTSPAVVFRPQFLALHP